MSDTLELSIYTFSLKEKRKRKGEYFNLGEFYRRNFIFSTDENPHKINQDELYKRFMTEVLKEFKNEFKLNKEKTKGISTGIYHSYGYSNIIDGFINGGDIGSNHKIFKIKNNKKSTGSLNNDEIVALPHYFKIWSPSNSEVGILMIQNYSNSGINTLLLNFFRSFFSKYNASFNETRHIPNELKESFINRSIVKKVVFTKTKLSKNTRKAFNYAFTDEEGIKIKIEISGFNKNTPVKNFIENFQNSKKMIGVDLSNLDIIKDDDVQTTLFYEDNLGKKAHAKIESKFQISPTIMLPYDLYINNSIDYDLIKSYTNGILNKIKIEIGHKS